MIKRFKKLFFIFIVFIISTSQVLAATRIVPNDSYYPQQWYLEQVKAPEAWSRNTGNGEVVVAVLDTGVQITHPDLKENIWVNPDEIASNGIDDDKNGYIDDVNGWDFVRDVPDPNPKFDESYIEAGIIHGTSIASIIAARGHNYDGIAGASWVNKIMPLRVLDSSGSGTTESVIRAISYAVDNGADIINLSFAGPNFDPDLLASIRAAYQAGIVIVAAAGNAEGQLFQRTVTGIDMNKKAMFPVCFGHLIGNEKMLIGVAALDKNDKKSSFSNYGQDCVDIAAPGEEFFTAYVKQEGVPPFEGYYAGYFEGTSVAAPVVAGAASIIKSILPNATPDDVYDILTQTTDDIYANNPTYVDALGTGRLNMGKAVDMAFERLGISFTTTSETKTSEETQETNTTIEIQPVAVVSSEEDPEIIVTPKSSLSPQVRIFDGKGNLIHSFLSYAESFTKGISTAVADMDNDGRADIITAPNTGGGPQIRIFKADGTVIGQFFAFDQSFRGGIEVSSGTVAL